MGTLRASVAAGESGPVIVLSGEVDITSAAQLSALIGGQLNAGAAHLTIDASGLSYLDSISIQVLVVVAKTLRARGGGLVLLRPQRPVARMLTLMGAGQVITIHRAIEAAPEPGSDAELARAAGSGTVVRRATFVPWQRQRNGRSRSPPAPLRSPSRAGASHSFLTD
jgi:anti-sigma B factor antagonist